MRILTALLTAALLAGPLPLLAQQDPAIPPPLPEPSTAQPATGLNTPTADAAADPAPKTASTRAVATKPGRGEKWREEVLAWKDPMRVEEGATEESITQIARSVLVLGTVTGDVSAVSGDIAVLGNVHGNVSAISGTVTVLGTVDGNVSAVSGNIRIAGKVAGRTSAVGGKIEKSSGAQVSGHSSSVGNGNWHGNFHWHRGQGDMHWDTDGGPGGLIRAFWFSSAMVMVRCALLIMWVALSCAVAAIFQPALLRAQQELRQAPARCAALGFLWVILFWMLLAGFLVLSLMLIGVPLVIVLFAFDLALKIFGMTLTFSVVGQWLAKRLNHPNASIYAAVFIGACALGILRIVPVLGSTIWFVAGLFGIGATLASRFGSAGNNSVPQIPASTAAIPA
jgi:hypothetical protein